MTARWRVALGLLSLAWVPAVPGCRGDPGAGALHARKVVLEREVEGLRATAARLEEGEPVLPLEDVVVGIDETLVGELIAAQLPFEIEVDRYRVWLDRAQASFSGSPLVTLQGGIALRDKPGLAGEVRLFGALEDVKLDPATGTLRAGLAVAHVDLLELAGVEGFLSGGTLDELARRVRLQLAGRLPKVTIPIKVEQGIAFPAVSHGPVRIAGATLPLAVAVSEVLAGSGQLWVAVSVQPGDMVKGTTRGGE